VFLKVVNLSWAPLPMVMNQHTRIGSLVDYLAFDGNQRAIRTLVKMTRTAVGVGSANVGPISHAERSCWAPVGERL
jgi:hypothetical protein